MHREATRTRVAVVSRTEAIMAPTTAASPKTLSPVSSLSRLDSEAFDKLRSNSYVQRTTVRNLGILQAICIVVFVLVT